MSYIAFDLDAINVAPDVARAAGLSEDRVLSGMARMWAWCFRNQAEFVTDVHVRGFFGGDALEPLIVFGFLASTDASTTFRVRGADRYLRVAEARKRGGRAAAAAGNLRRGAGAAVTSQQQLSSSTLPAAPGAEPQLPPRPTPSTEHRAPSTELKAASSGDAFFAWAQNRRHLRLGLPDERPPKALSAWFSEALAQVHGEIGRLEGAYEGFLRDPFWTRTGPKKAERVCPWSGWVSQWRDFVTPAAPPERTMTPLELGWRDRLKRLDPYAAGLLATLKPDRLDGAELVVTTTDSHFAGWCREQFLPLLSDVRIEHRELAP